MTPEREAKFKKVVRARQPNLTVILENVHDSHNIGAVLRTCDSVGIREIYVLNSDPRLHENELTLGKRSSSGARKWVEVHFYKDTAACLQTVKSRYDKIYSTHLDADAVGLYDLNLSGSVALLFGNEHEGLTKEALAYSDGNFVIPQVGMVESLNISVACAVTLYEAYRQRAQQQMYTEHPVMTEQAQMDLYEHYQQIHDLRLKKKKAKRIDPL
ncbi:MAG: RNA methyltransferase [Bacteroidota bacterium]